MASLHTSPQGQRHDRILSGSDAETTQSHTSPPPGRTAADPETETSVVEKMLCAVGGSILTSFLITPLDVVRVRLQAQQSPSPSARLPSFVQLPPNLGVTACCREVFWVQNQSQFCVAAPTEAAVMNLDKVVSDCAAEETQRKTINSTFDGLRKIARNEGIWTLWRGLSPTLLMSIPANVIYFAGYDWLRWSPKSPMVGQVSDPYAPLVAGTVARILAGFAVSPIEMLRTRMQASSSKEQGRGIMRSTIDGMKDMVAQQGVQSLWRGLSLTMWRDVPFSAMYWWGYEYGRQRLDKMRLHSGEIVGRPQNEQLNHWELLTDSFIAGAASGAIAAFVTTPFDVGKTRQQTVINSNMSLERRKALPEGKIMPRFLWHIYQHEGWNGLMKGWAARTLKVAPACAIMISSYEVGKKMSLRMKEKRDHKKDLE
ncbi:Mitochondrial carrier protein MTM1 [Pseudocercospora fuligena]|uniref:Mitochondrial carrier protein MTM1 n=1 Tax=Pseudocercospora fuligena TaxID=685502 RepID=A0A8H6VTG6_9PEZI|nr:Mitochondrial carrier protein MTM1 [Pseudocercospora fuligena]